MHVVWKRPDGFHGADPGDYEVVNVGGHSKLWLHRRDHSWYPFRVAGGWQESEATKRLNNLVNLLGQDAGKWVSTLAGMYNDTMGDNPTQFFDDLHNWIIDPKQHLKGGTWEVEIMTEALSEVGRQILGAKPAFMTNVKA